MFTEGRETTDDDSRSLQPFMSKTNENIQRIADWNSSVAEIIGTDKKSVCQIMHESFDMHKVCAKMVPKLLTQGIKNEHLC